MTDAATPAIEAPHYAHGGSLAAPPATAPIDASSDRLALAGVVASALMFAWLFALPATKLVRDWWNDPDAGHGLLLFPVAIWLAWRSGRHPDARPNVGGGLAILAVAVLARYVSSLAAELFTTRASMMLTLVGLTVFYAGFRQVWHWWLSFAVAALSIPLPTVVTSAISLPLQFQASELGASLLRMRNVPVWLDGNVIRLPGHQLFVAEACSGLRSLTALLALGVLLGGLMLRSPLSRIALIALAIPVAIAINGFRVFLTGFLVLFVDPKLAEGFTHVTEGWLLFLVSLSALGALAWLCRRAERLVPRWREEAAV
jgi:exosortase